MWILLSALVELSSPSTVVFSFPTSRIRRSDARTGCFVVEKSHSKDSASVLKPVLIFFVLGSFNSSNRTT